MDRRELIGSMLAAWAAAPVLAAETTHHHSAADHSRYHDVKHETIVLIAYPMLTALDLLGPQHMLACMMGAKVLIAAQTMDPVLSDTGLKIVPDVDFASCPRDPDLFLVPGGLSGTTDAMRDARMIDFVAELGAKSKYVTSVCTGSLILGAAGLLKGYRATSHWIAAHMLEEFGAQRVDQRVVFDRNRITGAGVTAGMDMSLAVVKMLRGEEYTKLVALLSEYQPEPPVRAGIPREAGPKATEALREMNRDWLIETEALARKQGAHV